MPTVLYSVLKTKRGSRRKARVVEIAVRINGDGMNTRKEFWSAVYRPSSDACWEWGAARSPQGYGKLRWGSRSTVRSHRVAWELANGPIPDGAWVLHRCDNPPCCNPSHLYLGDASRNTRDCLERRPGYREKITTQLLRGRASLGPATVETKAKRRESQRARLFGTGRCKHGHDVTKPENILPIKGGRRCRVCYQIRNKTRRSR